MVFLRLLIILSLLGPVPALAAPNPKQVERNLQKAVQEEQRAQAEVDEWAAERAGLLGQVSQEKRNLVWLEHQVRKHQAYVARQEETLAELERRIKEVKRLHRDLEPFLEEVVGRLTAVVASDPPFLAEERKRRIEFLKRSLSDYHLPLSEKLRRVLEALTVEVDYGRSADRTEAEVSLGGQTVRVEVLRLGRLALYARTPDGKKLAFRGRLDRDWLPLPLSSSREIERALEMAQRRRAVDLVVLPLPSRPAGPGQPEPKSATAGLIPGLMKTLDRLWPLALAADWPKAAQAVNKQAQNIRDQAEETRRTLERERASLQADLAGLKKDSAVADKSLKGLQERFHKLLKAEEDLRAELAAGQEEVRNLESVMRLAAREAETRLRKSLVSPERPGRLKVLDPFKTQGRLPGFADLQALVDLLFEEMAASAEISSRQGQFIDSSGRAVQGQILRVGNFTSFFQVGERVGFLRPTASGEELVALAAEPGFWERRDISAYFGGQGRALPLDLSGGAALDQLRPGGGVQDWLRSGGFLVWPILAVALAALILILERFSTLGRAQAKTDGVMDQVKDLLDQGDREGGLALLSARPKAPACRVVLSGLKAASDKEAESAVEETILRETGRLERFLPTLSVLAAIAPLLGLLGTVTGMIQTFQVITRFGTNDPRLLAGGISEALVTTELGLMVAIPVMVAHHFLERRVDKLVGDMEEKGLFLLGLGRAGGRP